MSDILELSKRVDNNNNEILSLRTRAHRTENTQAGMISILDKLDNNLKTIYENQECISLKMIESFKDITMRISEAEKITNQIKLVTAHWKSLLIIAIFFAGLGFAFDNGIKDLLRATLPDKAIKVGDIIKSY